ncbi:MAG: hypothetical protein KAT04_03055 [Methylococcales bacterium]|nr:hypothetical protein [Methylococcales bacterium]
MNIETIRELLAWCAVINFGILTIWFLGFTLARDKIYRLHGQWFKLSENSFDTIHYSAMAFYKLSIFMFNLVPYLVLRFLS